ncbi:DUF397 domain-containing protein [Streptomyces paludis]|uniref:DUF397 domain-containing protein n=1 Tax=Streptomyces paludis TaxID=2282738 RepID=A0A345HRT4_9ACTN|nr:DUF397 domain-containing protein [Streptomyces paludis]AXG79408.1 DUF397 domain-containing protein [Streptomyces paludis]
MSLTDVNAIRWRRSSYSNQDGGQCVEAAARWRKSTYSNSDGGQCLEVATDSGQRAVPVRDSKIPHGPVLVFPAPAFTAFVQAVQSDAFGV